MTLQPGAGRSQPDSLADVLERVLDKGVVIAGDIVVNVLDIELLSLKLRLFIASAQTAQEMGMDWWTRDPFFSGQSSVDGQRSVDDGRRSPNGVRGRSHSPELAAENEDLRGRVEALERALASRDRGEVQS
jgi:hypothetical protein